MYLVDVYANLVVYSDVGGSYDPTTAIVQAKNVAGGTWTKYELPLSTNEASSSPINTPIAVYGNTIVVAYKKNSKSYVEVFDPNNPCTHTSIPEVCNPAGNDCNGPALGGSTTALTFDVSSDCNATCINCGNITITFNVSPGATMFLHCTDPEFDSGCSASTMTLTGGGTASIACDSYEACSNTAVLSSGITCDGPNGPDMPTPPPPPPPGPNPTPPPPPPDDDNGGGLSTGAIVGIAVGAVTLVAAIVVFVVRARRKTKTYSAVPDDYSAFRRLLPPST
jgi:hypothetical protein